MHYQKIKQKLKVGAVATAMVVSNLVQNTAFASELYPGHDYVPLDNSGSPVFYISKIDPTNNQLEFFYNTDANNAEISGVEVGWIADRSTNILGMDILSYESATNAWSQRVFSNGTKQFSEYLDREDGGVKYYTVDAEVSLTNNVFKDLFYIVNLADGSKWINSVEYGDCGYFWSYGKSCNVLSFMPGMEYNNILYTLKDVEIKNTGSSTTESEPTNNSIDEPETQPNTDVVSDNSIDREPTTLENNEKVEMVSSEMPETIEKAVTVASFVKSTVEETDSEDFDEDEDDEDVYEGSGDTTLDVPLLGKSEKEINYLWWLPFFLGGAALGAISTWFLFSILKKRKESRTHII